MGRIIAIANQKGGVGKTTTCINLAASLSATKRRVLLVDMDPQGNATMGSGVDKRAAERTTYDVLMGECGADDVIVTPQDAGYALMPANGDLTAAEIGLMEVEHRERRLRDAFATQREHFDYILIDCPPSLNMLTLNALVAADSVMIPMQCEYYALEGLSALLNTIEKIRQSVNPALKVEGLLRTMFDPRNNLANDVSGQLINHFEDKVYRTIIPRNVRLAEAPSHGQPALQYDRTSRGALAYLALAGEILRREQVGSSGFGGEAEVRPA
jgi:chromosome partitioning protein